MTSISGGTDVVGCLVLGNVFSNVYSGEIQGESLGIDVDIFNEEGKKIRFYHIFGVIYQIIIRRII